MVPRANGTEGREEVSRRRRSGGRRPGERGSQVDEWKDERGSARGRRRGERGESTREGERNTQG
eukprot:552339-Hanusia_phi.AAC.1